MHKVNTKMSDNILQCRHRSRIVDWKTAKMYLLIRLFCYYIANTNSNKVMKIIKLTLFILIQKIHCSPQRAYINVLLSEHVKRVFVLMANLYRGWPLGRHILMLQCRLVIYPKVQRAVCRICSLPALGLIDLIYCWLDGAATVLNRKEPSSCTPYNVRRLWNHSALCLMRATSGGTGTDRMLMSALQ